MLPDRYAVVDRAILPDILSSVEQYESQAWCLFPEPVDEAFAQVAPYLVQVSPELEVQLTKKTTPWGFYFTSQASSKKLRNHLQSLLSASIEGEVEPLFFRYYDPRILWRILEALDNQAIHQFLGPLDDIQTCYLGNRQSATFQSQRAPFLMLSSATISPFPLTQEQYQQILLQCHNAVVLEVADIFLQSKHDDKQNEPDTLFAEQLVAQLLDWGITIPTQIKSIAVLCAENGVYNWHAIPMEWHNQLRKTEYQSSYRVSKLLYHSRRVKDELHS